MIKVFAVLPLVFTLLFALQSGATVDCSLSEMRVFSSSVTPDADSWMKADGRLIQIRDNQALFALIGNVYGGRGIYDFAIPKVQDLEIEGTAYNYYICYRGMWPSGMDLYTNTGFIRQYAGRIPLDEYYSELLEMTNEITLPRARNEALASFINKDLVTNDLVFVPSVVSPESIGSGDVKKFPTFLVIRGYYAANGIAGCEPGAVHFSLGEIQEPSNAKKLKVDLPVSFGEQVKQSAHVYECL